MCQIEIVQHTKYWSRRAKKTENGEQHTKSQFNSVWLIPLEPHKQQQHQTMDRDVFKWKNIYIPNEVILQQDTNEIIQNWDLRTWNTGEK